MSDLTQRLRERADGDDLDGSDFQLFAAAADALDSRDAERDDLQARLDQCFADKYALEAENARLRAEADQAVTNMRNGIRMAAVDAKLRVDEAKHSEDFAARAMNAENDRHIARIVELEAENARLREEKATDAWHTGWQEAVRRMQEAEAALAQERAGCKAPFASNDHPTCSEQTCVIRCRHALAAERERAGSAEAQLGDYADRCNRDVEHWKAELAAERTAHAKTREELTASYLSARTEVEAQVVCILAAENELAAVREAHARTRQLVNGYRENGEALSREAAALRAQRRGNPVERLYNLVDGLSFCDDCGEPASVDDEQHAEGPHILCHDCAVKHKGRCGNCADWGLGDTRMLTVGAAQVLAPRQKCHGQASACWMQMWPADHGCPHHRAKEGAK